MAIRYLSGVNIDSNTLFVDDANNRVGIGTTSPTAKLNIGSAYNDALVLSDGRSASPGTLFDSSITWDAYYVDAARITLTHNDYTIADRRLHFDLSGVEIMSLKSGNVGINNTAPAAKLHTVGTGIVNIVEGSSTVSYTQYYNTSTGAGGTSNGLTVGVNGLDAYVFQREAANLILGTSDAERMRITSGGNVGIGTTSPVYPLDLGTGGTGNSIRARRIWASGTGTDSGFSLNSTLIYEGASNSFNITNPGSYPNVAFTINNGGNVGIGTTSPTYKLDVATNLGVTFGASSYLRINKESLGDIGITAPKIYSGTETLGFQSNNGTTSFNFAYGATSLMTMKGNGNVGIGTASPTRLLDVSAVNPQMTLKSTTTTGFSEYYFSDSDGDPGYLSYAHNGDYLSIGVNGSDRMRITSAGNVGIGTTNPTTKLHVTGITQITEAGNAAFYGGNYVRVFNDQNFNFRNVGGSTIANISVSGSSFFNGGNVGIGTTSPSTKLHVVGYSRTDGGLVLNGSDANYREMIFTTSAAARWNLYAYGGESGSNSGSVLYLARYADNGDFIANVATFLRTNGYVGIATTTPTQQLHVSGNVRVTGAYYDSNNSAGTSGQVLSSTGSGTDWVSLSEITGVDGTGTANKVSKWSDADTITDSTITDDGTTVTAGVERFKILYQAGIYSFSDTVDASTSEDIFTISNTNGAQAFRVTFVCSTSGFSVAKTYEVVHSYGNTPVAFKVVDTGPYSGGHDFDVAFTDATNTGIKCAITNNSTTVNANIVTTIFLGGSPTTITVTEH